MAFDKDAFLAAFLGRVTTGIEERREEAKEYEQKQTEAAERNAALVQQRNMRAQQAAQIGKRAMALGANEAQVRTAMSSGMTGITELHQKLQEAVGQKGVKTLGAADIEAIVNMPSIPAVNTEMMDGSLDDFAKRTYGAMPIERAAVEDDTNIVGRLFGFGAMDRTKQKLAETDYMGGMTVADINAMSKQAEYQQLIPGAYMTFADVDYFTAEKALDFSTTISDTISKTLSTTAARNAIENARRAATRDGASPEDIAAAAQKVEQELIKTAVEPIVNFYADTYHDGGFFDNKLAVKQIESVLGKPYLDTLTELYTVEAPDAKDTDQEYVLSDRIQASLDQRLDTELAPTDMPIEDQVTPNVMESVKDIEASIPSERFRRYDEGERFSMVIEAIQKEHPELSVNQITQMLPELEIPEEKLDVTRNLSKFKYFEKGERKTIDIMDYDGRLDELPKKVQEELEQQYGSARGFLPDSVLGDFLESKRGNIFVEEKERGDQGWKAMVQSQIDAEKETR